MNGQMAMCRRCRTPLICTLHWARYEFYCLECGWHAGFLDPVGADPTPELDTRYAGLKAEWDEHAGGKLLSSHSWHRDCAQCESGRGEYHVAHATDEERAAHEDGVAWLAQRIRAEAS